MWKLQRRVKCKNCLHLNVCDGLYFNLDKECERTCGYFEDCSKYEKKVRGNWGKPFKIDAKRLGHKCSECGYLGTPCFKYCPNCGARMEGDRNGTT